MTDTRLKILHERNGDGLCRGAKRRVQFGRPE